MSKPWSCPLLGVCTLRSLLKEAAPVPLRLPAAQRRFGPPRMVTIIRRGGASGASAPEEERRQCNVYVLEDRAGKRYVGYTRDLLAREKQHTEKQDHWLDEKPFELVRHRKVKKTWSHAKAPCGARCAEATCLPRARAGVRAVQKSVEPREKAPM